MTKALEFINTNKNTLIISLYVLVFLLFLINLGFILKLAGVYYIGNFLFKNMLFAKDREKFLLSLNEFYLTTTTTTKNKVNG